MNDGEETHTQDQQRQTNAGAPLAPSIAVPTQNPNEPHGEDVHNSLSQNPQESVNWFRNPDWWMVVLTAFLFAVGAITLRVFYRQFREMQTQTGILNTQAKQAAADSVEAARKVESQLAIATKQTKAAQDTVKAMQRQMRQDQGAWMQITMPKPILIPTNNAVPGVAQIHFANTGKTAAIHVFATIGMEVVPRLKEPELSYKGRPIRLTGLEYPQNTFDFDTRTNDPIGQSDYQLIENGGAYLVAFGKVEYRDVFGTKHWTHFCTWSYKHEVSDRIFHSRKCTEYNRVDNN